ncbi:ankyrin repeat and SOCS box protein 2-like [Engraulis encrasicolus]|uniref:ankyrin repeat and SOCS box protein 2-like n=1 Tax=Engraulis encrasicolus TaxID=184585 RepID=UPI002FD6BE7E
MAAASLARRATMPDFAYEDYTAYGHMTDDELLQMAIERSLCEDQQGPSEYAQASFIPASEPPKEEHMPTFKEARQEYAARRNAALQAEMAAAAENPQVNPSSSSHTFDGDRLRLRAWKKRHGKEDLVEETPTLAASIKSAIWNDDAEAFKQILMTVPAESLNKPNDEGWIHLHEVAYYNAVGCSKLLLQAFPDLVNKRNDKSQTPLILAVGRKNLACVKLLINAGGDPNIANNAGETAVYKACEKGTEEILDAVLKAGGNPCRANIARNTPLHEAVGTKNVNMVKMLVEAGAKTWTMDSYGIESLFTAAQCGAADVLNYLIKLGGNINTQANDGATALYEASKNGHEECVKILLSKRADVNRTTKSGLTPLHVASKNGHVSVVLLLLPRTNRGTIRRSGISPLHLAAERNRDEIVEILIQEGFDVNMKLSTEYSNMYEDRRSTVLYFAVKAGNMEAASMLLQAGADPNLDVFNPVLVAVRKGNKEMVSLLVEYGANVNACMPTHPTTFPAAMLFCMKHRNMFKILLDNGLDADACFTCVYGNNTHPPVKIQRSSRDDLYLHGLMAPHTSTAQFCEVMADPLHSPWVGMILDMLLDYTGHVKLCSRLSNLLDNISNGQYIKDKAKPPFPLLHLCRVNIRKQVGHHRMKQMTSLPLPKRLIRFLYYDNSESENLLSQCGCL